MTWEEHEAEYCSEEKPDPKKIYDFVDRYCDAYRIKDYYEYFTENRGTLKIIRWAEKYYVVFTD